MADLYACVYVLYTSNTFDQLPRVQSVIFAYKRGMGNIYSNIMLFDPNMFVNKMDTYK